MQYLCIMFKETIQEIVELSGGKPDAWIVAQLLQRDVAVSQSTICRLRLGVIDNPSYKIGDALVQLRKSLSEP